MGATFRFLLAGGFLAILIVAPAVAAVVDLTLAPASQQVAPGAEVAVELWATSDEPLAFNSAQVILTWDPSHLVLTGNEDPAYPPPSGTLWTSSFPFGDSFGLNESNPIPIDGNGLWVGEVALGQTLDVTPQGLLLTTFLFDATAETDMTEVGMLAELQLPNRPKARSKFNVGTMNVLGDLGPPAEVAIGDLCTEFTVSRCMTGPDIAGPPAGCTMQEYECADLDVDDDVDLDDYRLYQLGQ